MKKDTNIGSKWSLFATWAMFILYPALVLTMVVFCVI